MTVQNKAIYPTIVPDIRALINSYLSINDMVALTYVDRAHKQAVHSSAFAAPFWEALQAKLGYYLEEKSATPLAERVIRRIFESVHNMDRLLPNFIAKLIIIRCGKIFKRAPNGDYLHPVAVLKTTRAILRWRQARDTLVVWRKIAEINGLRGRAPSLLGRSSIEETVNVANGFSQWITDNNALLVEKFSLNNEKLSFVGLSLNTFPIEIAQFSSLKELDIIGNRLSSVPAAIGQLTSLTELNITGNPLTSVPASLGQLISLKMLYLSENELTFVPATIGQLILLEVLYLSNNKLTALPESLGQLTSLREIQLQRNLLTSLPESIAQLSSLTFLNISRNQIPPESDLIQRLKGKIETLEI